MAGLFLPLTAQGEANPPKNPEEAKGFGLEILKQLPEAVKEVWQERVLPLWQKMWEWSKTQLKKLWDWFMELLNKEVKKIQLGQMQKIYTS